MYFRGGLWGLIVNSLPKKGRTTFGGVIQEQVSYVGVCVGGSVNTLPCAGKKGKETSVVG